MQAIRQSSFVMIAVITALAGSARADLVTNGGFETGDFTGWSTQAAASGSNFGVSANSPHTGSYHASFGAVNFQHDEIVQVLATTIGQVYTLEFWLFNASPSESDSFQVAWEGVTVFDQTRSLCRPTSGPHSPSN